ncbi:hypothetical protein LSH36_356g06009 [Paralvinella palmiformis]|uniref:Insulin receptor substrate 1 n=1 Tax=Paralvinella palmiformis TaxID=53620 RepID=A0AAD9JFF4_9ANNE|nr:hypothetical protein LSH36_356g06009 [Paralvinella palmiformis]
MDPLITGYMKYKVPSQRDTKQEWNKHFFVLFPYTPTAKARLDWYNDKKDFESGLLVRKSIFIEEITGINISTEGSKANQFELTTLRKSAPYLFRLDSKQDLEMWVNHLKKLVQQSKKNVPEEMPKGGEGNLGIGVYSNELWSFNEEPEEFPVTVGETESAVACQITNRTLILQLYLQCFTLKDDKLCEILYIWPYKYIRRYGKNNKTFTFEAGRSCASGQGVFVIRSPEAEEIFNRVHSATKLVSGTPHLPAKQYSTDNATDKYQHLTKTNYKHNYVKAEGKPKVTKKPPSALPIKKAPRPIPGPRPSNKDPVNDGYAEPITLQARDTEGYSDVNDARCLHPKTTSVSVSDAPFAVPHTQCPMSSIALKIKNNSIGATASDESEYDEVNLNGLKLAPEPANDDDDEVNSYGQLYWTGKMNDQ